MQQFVPGRPPTKQQDTTNTKLDEVKTALTAPAPTLREYSAGGYDYTGVAPAGSSETAAVWMIFREDSNGTLLYPNGDSSYSFKWSEKLTLSYS